MGHGALAVSVVCGLVIGLVGTPATATTALVVTTPPALADTKPPGSVTGLTVGTRTPTSVALSWTNPVDAENGQGWGPTSWRSYYPPLHLVARDLGGATKTGEE